MIFCNKQSVDLLRSLLVFLDWARSYERVSENCIWNGVITNKLQASKRKGKMVISLIHGNSTQPILGVFRNKNWVCTTRFSIVWPAITCYPGEFPKAISSNSDDDETNTTTDRLSAPQALFFTPGLRCLAVVRGRSKPWNPRVSRPTIIVLRAFRHRPSLVFNSPWPQ